VAGAVQELLDRSVGAEEYVIRATADGADADEVIDLNSIDFDALAARLAGKKRSSVQRIRGQLRVQLEAAARRNPSRIDLVERFRSLLEEYNAGSLNVDEMLQRLQAISRDLSEEEERAVREGLLESELAVLDLLTKPDPELTDAERDDVKRIARKLMERIQDRLVLDWRRKAETREAARVLIKDILDELPDAYEPEIWERKSEVVFNHIFASFYDDGSSVYEEEGPPVGIIAPALEAPDAPPNVIDIETVTAGVLERIKTDPDFAELVAEQLRGDKAFFAVPTNELIASDETYEVEFKSTARWNLREECKDKRMEDAIVKTIAGFLNTDGGTLLIGVSDKGEIVGLQYDLPLVKPNSPDGLVNWLTTHLIKALQHSAVMRTRARIDRVSDAEVCRIDVAHSSVPVIARMSDGQEVFWVRMNNSSRELPEIESEEYVRDHWSERGRQTPRFSD
jgi:type I restriction enzyme R subunit